MFQSLSSSFCLKNDGFVKSPTAVRHAHGPEGNRRAALRFISALLNSRKRDIWDERDFAGLNLHLDLFSLPFHY